MEHLVAFHVGVAEAIEVEFTHEVSIEGVYGSFEPAHGLGVGIPFIIVDDGCVDVAWKVFGDLLGKLGVVVPLVGFSVISHSTRIKLPRMPTASTRLRSCAFLEIS